MSFLKLGSIILLVGLVCHTVQAAPASSVRWLSDPNTAATEAAKTGKPILMQVTAKWCSYCHKMFRETYGDPQIADTVNRQFVCLKLDADKHKKVVTQLRIGSLPTTVVLTSDMRVIDKVAGYQSVAKLNTTISRNLSRIAAATPQKTGRSSITESAADSRSRTAQASHPTTARLANRNSTMQMQGQPNQAARSAAEVNPFANAAASAPIRPAAQRTTNNIPVRTVARTVNLPDGFDRMCLVTLFDDRRVTTGSPQFTSNYRGQTVYFATQEKKKQFDTTPQRYWPMLDGHCVVNYLDDNRQVEGVAEFGAVFRGRMWFFASRDAMKAFIARPKVYLPQDATPGV